MKIVIIGAEIAGMSAAAKARKADPGASITVFEQSGTISFGACGLPYFIGNFFSNATDMLEFSPEQYAAREIDVRPHHRVTAVNAESQTLTVLNSSTGQEFPCSYDRLLIATGATPIIPVVPGLQDALDMGRVSCVKTMQDGINLKEVVSSELIQDVAIVGAGYIGLEIADSLERQGKRVRIFESSDQPLADSFDSEVADLVTETLKARMVSPHWQESLTRLSISGNDRLNLETITSTGETGRYHADLIILCTGVEPCTEFVANLGLQMTDNGAIITDDQGRTSIDTIFAAGDCATVVHGQLHKPIWIPLATYASKMGHLAGAVMAGLEQHFPGAYGAACLKVMDLEAGRVGLSERDAAEHGIACKTTLIHAKDHSSYYPGQSDILIKLIYTPDTRQLLGGQIAGERGAVLRTNALAAAIRGGLTTEDLGMLDFCYSPPFAQAWDAMNIAGKAADRSR